MLASIKEENKPSRKVLGDSYCVVALELCSIVHSEKVFEINHILFRKHFYHIEHIEDTNNHIILGARVRRFSSNHPEDNSQRQCVSGPW